MQPEVAFSIFGMSVCLYACWRWITVRRIRTWAKTEGRVLRLSEEKRSTSRRGAYYVPRVEVAYSVEGREYRTRRFSLHNFTLGFQGDIFRLLPDAKIGETIPMRYDPSRPERAILCVPDYTEVIGSFVIGGFVLFITSLIGMR